MVNGICLPNPVDGICPTNFVASGNTCYPNEINGNCQSNINFCENTTGGFCEPCPCPPGLCLDNGEYGPYCGECLDP